MKILTELPPNYADIAKVFGHEAIANAVFTYGATVYNPNGFEMSEDLKAHERIHIMQQTSAGADLWWTMYLHDPMFRVQQELEAYQSQYLYACMNMPRGQRRLLLQAIAKDLAGPMYGRVIGKDEARKLIANKPASTLQ